MILIIEGPDGAGKTTYARSFRNATYHHEGPPPGDRNLVDYYLGNVERAHESQTPHVFDRSAMSEVVYGPILRGGSRIDRAGFEAFESGLRGLGAVTVICLPPYAACWDAFEAKYRRGQELLGHGVSASVANERFERAYRHFEALAKTRIAYDWTVNR